ncbi:MAG: serine hydrolase [Pseudomonadales bacterium]|nr:serine hydrolase [Pseudomonadales bacterium]
MKQLNQTQLAAIRTLAEETGTAQLCIVQGGEVLLDEAWHAQAVDVFAVQKGVLALLMGIAEEKYLIELVDHINHHIDPEWTLLSPWDEAKLSIEIMLAMTTGMDDELRLNGEIGKTWRYNNVAYNYLKKALCEQSGLSLNELSSQWLFEPLGLATTHWVEREHTLPDGRHFTALMSTARDLATIGEMVLSGGMWQGQPLVPGYFLEQMSKPASEENPAWGYLWWNNDQSHFMLPMKEPRRFEGAPLPEAPADLIAARGAWHNSLSVVPSLELVIARTAQPESARSFDGSFWHLLKHN